MRRLLSPIFERLFHPASYGIRPGRNCHQAVAYVLRLCRGGYPVVLDADISGFFDKIPHHVVMAAVAHEVADGNILRLVERFLKSGVMEDGVFKPTHVGTPQGGVISPLCPQGGLQPPPPNWRTLSSTIWTGASTKRAIGLSDWLFASGRRLGHIRPEDIPPYLKKSLQYMDRTHIIDAKVKTNFTGHNYFHASPAVSSDLILMLRDNLDPGKQNGRPLLQIDHNYWEITDDYLITGLDHRYNEN